MKVSQDTRTIKPGEWFVPVKGEHYDGHRFIPEALKKRAAGVLEVAGLYALAKQKIKKLKPKVIAITGSYGKTGTKEAISKVLKCRFNVSKTEGNLNTPLGVAIEVVNNFKPGHQIFVAEVGMDHLGEIRESCELIKPQVGVITSVGEMHLEKLNTLKNIKKAKSELLELLPYNGVAILNGDDGNVREIAKRFSGRKIWYGSSPKADVSYFRIKDLRFRLLGEGRRYAALAAYAVGRLFKIPEVEIIKALESLRPQKGRLNPLPGKNGSMIIDDTYNAGPRSMEAALEVLKNFPAKRRIAILGDMLELGKLEEQAHLTVLAYAFEVADIVVLVGERMNHALNQYLHTILADRTKLVTIDRLRLKKGDVVLVKGSQGMRMERIAKKLLEDEAKAAKLLVRQDPQWIC
ncbi:hypothetical protein COT70_00145 [candidate division WWE3 bacterium CG09_land_8_20_14_0_10_47_33]|nr:MAG: hypothetical protein COT70_00145 [candidate division WWE3 bacterium CG09_land_8_20_14_0_10_47_33]PJE52317.1 MAG: hypothetical protein COV28_00390 [candidate division WWE3 bacterium CG10_big_fil_rev_8_21_14_0_10_48_23]